MKLGARIFKTGIAIVFALYIAQTLGMSTPVFAGIAAIFALQPSIYRSFLTIIEQIQGNIIGAFVAIVFVLLFGNQLIIVGLAAVIIILIMLKLGLDKNISLALVMMIAIMEIQDDAFLTFALQRFLTVVIGVLSAFLVNLVFLPPKYETKLFQSIQHTQQEIISWTRLAGRQVSEHLATKASLKTIKERMKKIDELYSLFKEERSYLKKNLHGKGKKLVIYRQLIASTKSSYEVLKKLHQFEKELINLPEHFRMMIQERLDNLLTYHEQLMLMFAGKLKADRTSALPHEEYIQRYEVMEIFLKEIAITKEEEEFSTYHLLHILSAILNYEEQLEHLDRFITYYQKHMPVEDPLEASI